jgi:hypothetical protein
MGWWANDGKKVWREEREEGDGGRGEGRERARMRPVVGRSRRSTDAPPCHRFLSAPLLFCLLASLTRLFSNRPSPFSLCRAAWRPVAFPGVWAESAPSWPASGSRPCNVNKLCLISRPLPPFVHAACLFASRQSSPPARARGPSTDRPGSPVCVCACRPHSLPSPSPCTPPPPPPRQPFFLSISYRYRSARADVAQDNNNNTGSASRTPGQPCGLRSLTAR